MPLEITPALRTVKSVSKIYLLNELVNLYFGNNLMLEEEYVHLSRSFISIYKMKDEKVLIL